MRFILGLILLTSLSTFADGPTGDLAPWSGWYETTKCIKCPDHIVESGANLKNFIQFGFGYGKIDPKDKASCAQTDTWIGMDFIIRSDDKNITSSIGHTAGQCFWGGTYGKVLTATRDLLSYKNTQRYQISLTLKKTGPNTYLFHQTVHNDQPSWGYPKDWEYEVEMKKVSSELGEHK